MTSTTTPLHLYVHTPYCVHKCPYCDFNSHASAAPPWDAYQSALLREMAYRATQMQCAGRKLESIFFGGGTPSLAAPELIEQVLQQAFQLFNVATDIEISLESNPGAVDSAYLPVYRQVGINRLSIGVQSFHNEELRWLERIHQKDDVLHTFHAARQAGFDNINLDLMYGLPGQTIKRWVSHLDQALALAPEHLSCYQLTIEPHTLLASRHLDAPLSLPDEAMALDFFHTTRTHLNDGGFTAYEISNFSRSGYRCRHNEAYWLYDDYIGIGAGACGKWDQPDGSVQRYTNIRSPERYIKHISTNADATHHSEIRSLHQAAAEATWLGLRRKHGIERNKFADRFHQDIWTMFGSHLSKWQATGRLALTPTHLVLTPEGIPLLDSIVQDIL